LERIANEVNLKDKDLMEYNMSNYQDVYGVLGLAAMPSQGSLFQEESVRQFKKNRKMATYNPQNVFVIDSGSVQNEDAYECSYEHIWEGFFNEV